LPRYVAIEIAGPWKEICRWLGGGDGDPKRKNALIAIAAHLIGLGTNRFPSVFSTNHVIT